MYGFLVLFATLSAYFGVRFLATSTWRDAFAAAGRDDQAAAERAEGVILGGYLPAQLSDEEVAAIVAAAIDETGASGMTAMGQVMKVVTPRIAGRADGARVAAEVRRRLTS